MNFKTTILAAALSVSSTLSFAQAPAQEPSIITAFPEQFLSDIFESNNFRERAITEINKKYGQRANNIVVIVTGDVEWFPVVQQCVYSVSTLIGAKNEKVDADKVILSRSFSPMFHRTGIVQTNDPSKCAPDIGEAMRSVLSKAVDVIGSDPRQKKAPTPGQQQKPGTVEPGKARGKEWI